MESDSDFYGDEETVSALEARVDDFDIVEWWDRHPSVTHPLHKAAHSIDLPRQLYNPYEGMPGAWQLGEPIEDFVKRLPPATTDWRTGLDWIWVANPYSPAGPDQSLSRFRKGGRERLALFSEFQKVVAANREKASGSARASLDREVAKERRAAVEDLRELAAACNVVTGKWMLFPLPGYVNEVWAKIAKATATGRLGIAAKVDTKTGAGKERVICVYTRDFRDKDDVARVLTRLRELELVNPGGKQLYYKSDAWTELGIYRDNSWGIGPSMYSSNEIFTYLRTTASQNR